jgi:hypothetical protein
MYQSQDLVNQTCDSSISYPDINQLLPDVAHFSLDDGSSMSLKNFSNMPASTQRKHPKQDQHK